MANSGYADCAKTCKAIPLIDRSSRSLAGPGVCPVHHLEGCPRSLICDLRSKNRGPRRDLWAAMGGDIDISRSHIDCVGLLPVGCGRSAL